MLQAWLLAAVAMPACKSRSPSSNVEAVTASAVTSHPAPTLPIEQQDPPWRRALRVLDYASAVESFDREHSEPTEPGLRFVRAKLAFELGQHQRLTELCPGLAEAIPRMGQQIRRWCALAALQAGDAPDIARDLARSTRVDDALLAIDELVVLGEFDAAKQALRDLWDRSDKAPLSQRARIRLSRARLLEQLKEPAAREDYRWLALSASSETAASGADEAWERLTGKALSKRERFERAEAFTKAAQVDAVKRELEKLQTAPGPPIAEVLRLRTLAWAYYKSRRDYERASELFSKCARLDKTYRTQDMFYAARSLSRAHRDEDAIVAYRALAKRAPESSYAEEARFLIGRLHFVLGQWDHAVKAHTEYLEKGGRFTGSARYERAIAELARGGGEAAAVELRALLDASNSERERAFLRHLMGVSYLQQGKVAEAAGLFVAVIQERPLSFAAMVSDARLRELGQVPPKAISALEPSEESKKAQEPLRVELPASVRWFTELGLELEAERELKRVSAELESQYAPRGGEALCQAYGQLAVAEQRYRHAQRTVRERVLQRAITPETQWLWDCIYPTPYADAVRIAEGEHEIEHGLVHAVMRQESAFAPQVRSPANAIGLMQLIPSTAASAAKELGWEDKNIDLRIPAKNIELGAFYLGKLIGKFDGHAPLAAAGYNAGPGAVARWLHAAGDLPLDVFVAYVPYTETRNYVRRVMGNWARYSYLQDGLETLPRLSLKLPQPVQVGEHDY